MRAAATGLAGSGVLRCLAAGSQVGLSCRSEARFVPSGIFLCCTSLPRAGLRLIRLYNPMFPCRPGPASNGWSPPSRSGSAGGGRTARLHCNGSGSGSDSGGGPPPDQWHYTEYSPRAGHPPADWPPRHRLPLVPPLPLPAFEGHPWIILLTRAAKFRGVSATCGILFFQMGSVGVIVSNVTLVGWLWARVG